MSDIIWWFGAITAGIYALLGTVICIAMIADLAVRRAGWAPMFLKWAFEHYRKKSNLQKPQFAPATVAADRGGRDG